MDKHRVYNILVEERGGVELIVGGDGIVEGSQNLSTNISILPQNRVGHGHLALNQHPRRLVDRNHMVLFQDQSDKTGHRDAHNIHNKDTREREILVREQHGQHLVHPDAKNVLLHPHTHIRK